MTVIAMTETCPFCLQENVPGALVCASCSRDVAVPVSLLNERDELARKRDAVREELSKAKRALEQFKRGKQRRPV
jgi:hypothetical protein